MHTYRIVARLNIVLTLLIGAGAGAQTVRQWRITPAFCQANPGQCSCSSLRRASLRDIIDSGSGCSNLQSGDRIRYECDDLANGCVEQGATLKIIQHQNVEVFAEPSRSVTIRGPSNGPTLVIEPGASGWTFDGLVFDGNYTTASGGVVRVKADRTTIRRSIIKNGSKQFCLGISGDRAGSPARHQPVQGFTLEASEVSNCVDKPGTPSSAARNHDIHCLQSYSGVEMSIRDNIIRNCQGDGIQLENDYSDLDCYTGNVANCKAGLWSDVTISGNVFESRPDDSLAIAWSATTGVGIRPGENAVDVKAGQGLLRIIGNVMKGYRSYNSVGAVGLGSGHPDNQGAAITVSGPFENCGAGPCLVIAGNDISDSTVGIAISQSPMFNGISPNKTRGIEIRRNVIHDLSDRYDDSMDPTQKGVGIRLGLNLENLSIRHNTIANTPGSAVYFSSTGTCTGTCELGENVFSYAGYFGNPNHCASNIGTRLAISGNLCAPASDPRPECTGPLSPVASIGFVADAASAHPTQCGVGATPQGDGDFGLNSSSSAIGQAGTGVVAGATTCSSAGSPDSGANRDIGAKEYCTAAERQVSMQFNQSSAKIEMKTADWYRMATEFIYSKGEFSNALSFEGLPNAFCNDSNDTRGCLLYTRRCEQLCGRVNGEVDCSCLGNHERQFGVRDATQGLFTIHSVLHVDQSSTGTFNDKRESISKDSNGNPYRAMASSFISAVERTQEWEDLATDDQGDKNDFIASVKVLTCNTEGRNQALDIRKPVECVGEQAACQQCGKLSAEEVAVSYSLSADEPDAAEYPEGRRLFLSVNVWRSVENPAATPWKPLVAVCPVLHLSNDEGNAEVMLQNFHGGTGATCSSPIQVDGIPDCDDISVEAPKIALSRNEYHGLDSKDVCNALPTSMDDLNVNDSFVLESSKQCGNVVVPSVKTLTYEVPWGELMRALPPGHTLTTGTPRDQLDNYIKSVQVFVFSDIQSERFMCPSGVNVALRSADAVSPSLAYVAQYKDDLMSTSVGPRE